MIKFLCDTCGTTIKIDEEHAGKKCKCPSCKKILTIPADLIAEPVEKSEPVPARTPTPLDSSQPVPSVPVGSDKEKIKYKCPECGKKLENAGSMGGLDDKCPLCGNVHTVPLSKGQKKTIREQDAQAAASTVTPKKAAHSEVKPLLLNEATLKKLSEKEAPPSKPTPASRIQGLPDLLSTIAMFCWAMSLLILLGMGFYLFHSTQPGESLNEGLVFQSITLALVVAWGGVAVMWMSHVLSCLRDASQQTWWSMTYLQSIDEKLTQSLLNQKQINTNNTDSSSE